MNEKNHTNRGGYESQTPDNPDAPDYNEGSLWNSPIGRRVFLKRTGAATVATAVALHGFRVQVQANQTPPPVPWKPKLRTYTMKIYAKGPDGNGVMQWTTNINQAVGYGEGLPHPAAPALPQLQPGAPPVGNTGVWGPMTLDLLTKLDVQTNAAAKQGFPKFNPNPIGPANQFSEPQPGNPNFVVKGYTLSVTVEWEYTDGQ